MLVPFLSPGWDVAIITRPPIVSAHFADIHAAIYDVCLRAELVKTEKVAGGNNGRLFI